MEDFTNNNNPQQEEEVLDDTTRQNKDLLNLDDMITSNANDLMNIDIKESSGNNESISVKKDNVNKSNEIEPLKKDSSEVIQVPSIEKTDTILDENTLNESILTTIYRDLNLIYTKLKFVIMPYASREQKNLQIKQWDLWGPLLLDMFLAVTLAINSKEKSNMIILIFVVFWVGGILLYLNANFLGVKSSIFQIFCLLGYSLFPLNLSALFVTIFNINYILRIIIVGITCLWSIYSVSDFLNSLTNQEQRYLVLYPCILFYLYISWFIVSSKI